MITNTTSDQQKHSAAHALAMAVNRLYKNVKIGVGPVTKDGFYYDFDVSQTIGDDDLKRIESEINSIIQEKLPFRQIILNREEATNLLLQRGQIYKAELIRAIPDYEISFYKTGEEFIDLCRGPHVSNTNQIGLIKLIKVENTHWNEDPSRPRMQRIHGKVFNNLDELQDYEKMLKDLQTKNYKALSSKFSLATIYNNKIIFSDRGTYIHQRILDKINDLFGRNKSKFLEINESFINDIELDHALERMLFQKQRSYRDFPLKYNYNVTFNSLSFSKSLTNIKAYCHRYYLLNYEIIDGLGNNLETLIKIFKTLNIEISADIITFDQDEMQTQNLSSIFQRHQISHNKIITSVNSIMAIIKAKDRFDKEWILSFVKLNKFSFADQMLISVQYNLFTTEIWKYLVEKYEGIMPKSLSPQEIVCIPVNKNFNEYARKVNNFLRENGFSSEVDDRSHSLKFKIRRAESNQIPVQLIIGEKESANNAVSLRENQVDGGLIKIEDLVDFLKNTLG